MKIAFFQNMLILTSMILLISCQTKKEELIIQYSYGTFDGSCTIGDVHGNSQIKINENGVSVKYNVLVQTTLEDVLLNTGNRLADSETGKLRNLKMEENDNGFPSVTADWINADKSRADGKFELYLSDIKRNRAFIRIFNSQGNWYYGTEIEYPNNSFKELLTLFFKDTTAYQKAFVKQDENQPAIADQSSFNKNESNILLDGVKLKFSDGTLLPLSDFPEPANGVDSNESIDLKFSDLDNDGLRELFITYMEIGGIRSLVTNMFEQVSPDVYKHIIQFDEEFGIDLVAGRIVMDFSHAYRYFHACGACYIDNELPSRSAASDITLVYKDNKLTSGNPDQGLNDRIIKDLVFLSTRDQPDDNNMYDDDGTRKAYGTLITSYYFNNDRNIDDTKAIFTEYYRNPDVNEIWNEIESTIKSFGI